MELPPGWNNDLAENTDEQAQEEIWRRIRSEYEIPHPERKDEFENREAAADVIIHYWLGEEIDSALLQNALLFASGDTRRDTKLFKEAVYYATNLTNPGSPEREYVERADNYLFWL